ncbi:hypothetical protein TNCV_2666201 [Trichonephila clavipes]|nr:hypothetical protein TNCV_2666201 [Trichonephila clavipes]
MEKEVFRRKGHIVEDDEPAVHQSEGKFQTFTKERLHTYTIAITAQIESLCASEDNLITFDSSLIHSSSKPLQTKRTVSGCQWQYT